MVKIKKAHAGQMLYDFVKESLYDFVDDEEPVLLEHNCTRILIFNETC